MYFCILKNRIILNSRKYITQYCTLLAALLLAFFYSVQYTHTHHHPVHTSGNNSSPAKDSATECAICHIIHTDRTVLPLSPELMLSAPEQIVNRLLQDELAFKIPKGFDALKSNKDPPC